MKIQGGGGGGRGSFLPHSADAHVPISSYGTVINLYEHYTINTYTAKDKNSVWFQF